MCVIQHKLHSFWFYCLDTVNLFNTTFSVKSLGRAQKNGCPTKLGNIFLPMKAGKAPLSMLEAKEKQDWKIEREGGEGEEEQRQTDRPIPCTKWQGSIAPRAWKAFVPSPTTGFSIKARIILQKKTTFCRASLISGSLRDREEEKENTCSGGKQHSPGVL